MNENNLILLCVNCLVFFFHWTRLCSFIANSGEIIQSSLTLVSSLWNVWKILLGLHAPECTSFWWGQSIKVSFLYLSHLKVFHVYVFPLLVMVTSPSGYLLSRPSMQFTMEKEAECQLDVPMTCTKYGFKTTFTGQYLNFPSYIKSDKKGIICCLQHKARHIPTDDQHYK